MRIVPWVGAVGLLGLLGGCGGAPPAPPRAAPPPAARPPAPPPKAPEVKAPPPVSYEAKGRRDPFREPVTGVEAKGGLTVAEVKLVGILYGRQGPMALVEAPDGLGYILRPGDLLGNGRVLEVGLDSVTFSVTPERPGQPPTRTVLKLKTD